MSAVLASRIRRLAPSPVREILRAAAGARDLVSLAGGLPSDDTFPGMPGLPEGWMQYGVTEGDEALREAIAEHVRGRGLDCVAGQVVVLNGSQQGLDLAAKLLVEEGTPVLCESPTYVAALQVFRLFGAELHGMPLAPDGPDPATLPGLFEASRPRLAYVIPSFQNPTGTVWSDSVRDAFAREADRSGTTVVEDDPYGEIAFGAAPPRPVCARLERASWIFLGSFSKSFVPGLRLGFLVASPDLLAPLERLKQASDLHSNRLAQALVLADLRSPDRSRRLDDLRDRYRRKRDRFAESLNRHFPSARWTAPDGGLFFWAHLGTSGSLLPHAERALERGVAFLPGEHCFPGAAEPGWARLNFSHATPERAEEGLRRLAEVVRDAG